MNIFRSVNNPDIENLSLENQAKHITNYYLVIQQYYRVKNEKDKEMLQEMINYIKIIESHKFTFDFSLKDIDI